MNTKNLDYLAAVFDVNIKTLLTEVSESIPGKWLSVQIKISSPASIDIGIQRTEFNTYDLCATNSDTLELIHADLMSADLPEFFDSYVMDALRHKLAKNRKTPITIERHNKPLPFIPDDCSKRIIDNNISFYELMTAHDNPTVDDEDCLDIG